MITTIKAPDRKAPRFRQTTIGLLNKDVLSSFREKYSQFSHYPDDQLKKIIETFNGFLWQAAIDNRDGVELPEGLGNVFIGSCKSPVKVENLNHDKSQKHNMRVINRNLATDGNLAKIFYTNSSTKYRFRFRNLWKFKGARQFTNATSCAYKQDWPKYIVIEDYEKISNRLRNIKRGNSLKKLSSRPISDKYNEFDMD